MKRFHILLFAAAVVLLAASARDVVAQPGGGARGGARITATMVLGALAMEEKLAVTDAQLLELRKALKPVYGKEQEIMAQMRAGEREDAREKMMALRGELMEAISTVLSEEQIDGLKKHIQSQQRSGGRGGRPQRGS